MFVCDISIINADTTDRLTPNPNVLVELGYAIAQLGWDRILLIQNLAYGGPETLPFDLRGRRVIAYDQAESRTDKAAARNALVGRLEGALKDALKPSTNIFRHAGADVPIWWGNWDTADDGGMNGGSLFIYEVGPAGFLFTLSVYSGAHTGSMAGYARLVASDLAYCRRPNGDSDETCEIVIKRRRSENLHIIEIEETGSCSQLRGMGAWFGGTFIRKRDMVFDCSILDELDLARLYRLIGNHYEHFRRCFQGIGIQENEDLFMATVGVGGVRGLYTIMEAIVMRGEHGELWTAFIHDDVVRYYTTECEYKDKLPKTIEAWRERFKDKELVFGSCVNYIPKLF